MICGFGWHEKRNPNPDAHHKINLQVAYMPLYWGPPPPSGDTHVMTW